MFSKFRSDFRLSAYVKYYRLMRAAGILLVLLTSLTYCSSGQTNLFQNRDHIARIDIEYLSEHNRHWTEYLRDALENPRAKSIVLVVDQSSGSGLDLFDVEYSLGYLKKAKSVKPVVSFIYGNALGGSYVLASEANYMVSQRTATLGGLSIAVSSFDAKPLLDKIGIDLVTKGYGDLKVQPDKKDKNYATYIQHRSGIYKGLYLWMLDTVINNRSLSKENVGRIASGEWYLGERAVEYGLCDAVGDLEAATQTARKLAKVSTQIEMLNYSQQHTVPGTFEGQLSHWTQALQRGYRSIIEETTAEIYRVLVQEFSRSLRYVT